MTRKAFRRVDPWTELQSAARNALRYPQASRAVVGMTAERSAYAFVDGIAKPHALTLNALRSLAIAWRDVPDESRVQFEAAIEALTNALDQWPPHMRATLEELQARRKTSRRATTMPAPASQWWQRD